VKIPIAASAPALHPEPERKSASTWTVAAFGFFANLAATSIPQR
jgi:hypothetical protein